VLDSTLEVALDLSDDLASRIERGALAPCDASVFAHDPGIVEDRAFSRHTPVGIVCGFKL
jgi:hypothetical protein